MVLLSWPSGLNVALSPHLVCCVLGMTRDSGENRQDVEDGWSLGPQHCQIMAQSGH